MSAKPLSSSEQERIDALRDLNILDTPREERYDRIVRIAAQLFAVPIVLLALEDEDRQWFKAAVGVQSRELPRDVAFSSLPTLQDEVFIVPDTLKDSRFSQYALVKHEPYARFYAGSVIHGRNGVKVGSLGILDTKPRKLSNQEVNTLRDLAKWVEREFELVENERLSQKLRESEERFRRLSEATIEGVSIHSDGCILQVNERFAEMFGFENPEAAVGTPVLSLVVPEQHDEVMSHVGVDRTAPYRWTAIRQDGTTFPAESEARSFTMRNSVVRVVAIRDITVQEQTEFALREAHERALSASQAKSQFLATMSHEIRTPLNAIIGMAELLHDTELSPEQKRYVEIFQRSGDHLLKLINDILDLSKIEAGQLEIEQIPMSLRDLMESVGEVIAMRAHAKGLELAVHVVPEVPSEIMGDPERLRQVIVNLAGNAVKFTESGEVVIRVEVDPESDTMLRFAILDTGIGIAPDKLHMVFDTFTQADASTTRKYGGTGLGLAISKQLVEMMGGRIWVESVVGEGSRFYFTLPVRPVGAQWQHSGSERPALDGIRVLVVDDNATNRFILKEMLNYWGADVSLADSGQRALRMLREVSDTKPYELILLDCQMPEMDGFEVAAEITSSKVSPGVAMMMLTSDNRTGDANRAKQMGIGAYLVKPVKKAELLEVIQGILDRNRITTPVESSVREADHLAMHGHRILVAEDAPDNRFLIEAYLKNENYHLVFAENGLEAVEQFANEPFDLVLMDMQMPEMDGYEASRQIRAIENQRGVSHGIPILALTAYSLLEDHQKSLDAGCTDHLTKPIKKSVLLAALESYLRSTKQISITVDADLQELIPEYLGRREADIKTIRSAIQDKKFKVVETLAHQMKGSGGGYGLQFISDCGQRMEEAVRNMDLESVHQTLGQLEEFIKSLDIVYR